MAHGADALTVVTTARSRQSNFAFLLQVCRPGLWSTTALFYLMPLGRFVDFRSARFWVGLVYVLIPLGFVLYGVNDIFDVDADRLNVRKGTYLFGSLGQSEQLAALRWQIAAVQIPFVAAFLIWIGAQIVVWLAVLLGAVWLYNVPPIACKGRPPLDVLMQASYLLVFVLSSWVNRVPQLPWQTFVFGALFAMHSHLFGEVMDIAPDRASGRITTAAEIGAVGTKLLIAAFLGVEAVLVAKYFHEILIAGFLAAGALWFIADALWLWGDRPYSRKMMGLFMWGWNAAAVLLIVWGCARGTLTQAAL